jgi:hypothetical protein
VMVNTRLDQLDNYLTELQRHNDTATSDTEGES